MPNALVVQDSTTSGIKIEEIVEEDLVIVEPGQQAVLEVGEDEYYSLEELDAMDKSMAFMARMFPNIKYKKPRSFIPKAYQASQHNNSQVENKFVQAGRSGAKSSYGTSSVDRAKIRCFNCNEMGLFAIECRRSKQVRKDRDYLELEAKYEALFKKQYGKAFIAE